MLSVSDFKSAVSSDQVESVIVGFPDMYGRLMGKRFDPHFFVSSCLDDGTHACDYLLASDMEMTPLQGFDYANWERGFGDFHMIPDKKTLRRLAWLDRPSTEGARQKGVVLCICDVHDTVNHSLVSVAPRSVLRAQIDAASASGHIVNAATELEYYMYEQSYRAAFKSHYEKAALTPVGDYLEDYHMLQTAREEKYTRVFRDALTRSGIKVENSKGEAGVGQHELNVAYGEVLDMADKHIVYKQCLKEISDHLGVSLTFMAKPFTDATGSGCHIHLSLHNADGSNAFTGTDTSLHPAVSCSPLFRHFLAGWLKYTPDCMVFYAPTVNSYKRFITSSWAPTRLAWSYDNRTAGFRVVGSGKSLRIECRIPGADCNPYLAFAASLASGLRGVKDKLGDGEKCPPCFTGNLYAARKLKRVPQSLKEAVALFRKSAFAQEAFGEDVVNHYAHFYEKEVQQYDEHVSDWERKRYFERI